MSRTQTLALACALTLTITACSEPDDNAGGEPSLAEYVAALEDTAACLENEGYSVGEVEQNPDGITYGFDISAASDGDDGAMDALDDAYASCAAQHLDSIEREYLNSVQLSGAEREQAYREMIVCFEGTGLYGVEVGDTEGEVGQALADSAHDDSVDHDEAQNCFQRYLIPLFGV